VTSNSCQFAREEVVPSTVTVGEDQPPPEGSRLSHAAYWIGIRLGRNGDADQWANRTLPVLPLGAEETIHGRLQAADREIEINEDLILRLAACGGR
jgi:hypothetical protein